MRADDRPVGGGRESDEGDTCGTLVEVLAHRRAALTSTPGDLAEPLLLMGTCLGRIDDESR